jgi:uncharacterized protein (AIM24 family)
MVGAVSVKVQRHPAGFSAGSSVPSVTGFAFARLLDPGAEIPTLTLTVEGHLMVTVRGEIMVRTEPMLLQTDNLQQRPLNRRMQGRAVPQVFRRLVAVAGEGHIVLSRESQHFYPLMLQRDLCFFAERYLWALEAGLMWDVGLLPGSRSRTPISLVRAAGEGAVALRVPGGIIAIKVTPDRPYRVHGRALVGWIGGVIPTVGDEATVIRCEGEGAVLVNLPSDATAGATEASG